MKERIKATIKHPLISGSSVIFFGSIFGNVFNFLFNLFMSRNLSVGDYGVLASITSVIWLPSLMAGSVIPTIVNFGATYFAKGELGMVRNLFFKTMKVLFAVGMCIFLIFFFFSSPIGSFFKIDNQSLIIVAGLFVFLAFIGTINNALLQAKLAFGFITFTNVTGAILKFVFGALLVLLGFAVGGALWGFFVASLIAYLLTFIPLAFLFRGEVKEAQIDLRKIFSYGIPASITLTCMNSFIMTDVILMKHFLSPQDAGMYAGISLVGRVIYFLTAPIATVMFPLIVQRHEKGEEYQTIFKLSLLIVLLPSIAITLFYFIFPDFSILFFLKKEEYFVVKSLLGPFGIFITIYSLVSLLVNFYLSIKKTNIYMPTLVFALAQLTLLWFFHSSLYQVILLSIACASCLLLYLLGYHQYLYGKHKE